MFRTSARLLAKRPTQEQVRKGLDELRDKLVASIRQTCIPALSNRTQKKMWQLHSMDPVKYSVENLSAQFGLKSERTRNILVHQGIEQHEFERGAWTASPAQIERLENAMIDKGWTVQDSDIESQDDPGIAKIPHQGQLAMLAGEIDEVEYQRIVSSKSVEKINKEIIDDLFPRECPENFPLYLRDGHRIKGPTRKVPAGKEHVFVMDDPEADPTVRRMTCTILIFERDGGVRTANWKERVDIMTVGERRPRPKEMDPIFHVRKHTSTPIFASGRHYGKAKFLAHEALIAEGAAYPRDAQGNFLTKRKYKGVWNTLDEDEDGGEAAALSAEEEAEEAKAEAEEAAEIAKGEDGEAADGEEAAQAEESATKEEK